MPRLVLFAPCTKVIVSADDQTVSLVSLLDGVSIPAPDPSRDEGSATTPLAWEYVALWAREHGDDGQSFEQRLDVLTPDRRSAADVRHRFEIAARTVRVRASVVGFPVGIAGECLLRLSYRNAADPDVWQRVAEYPVLVMHLDGPDAQALGAAKSTAGARSRRRPRPTTE
jgi:hypothetical protein